MNRINVCVLFGGVSPEHEVSLRSACSILEHLDKEKYRIFPVGITRKGTWILYGGSDFSDLLNDTWENYADNEKVVLSPVRDEGLVIFAERGYQIQQLDCIFPVLHGENGEDGSIQGIMQVAGIPCVGCGVRASVVAMDKTLTKLVADSLGIRQAKWLLVTRDEAESGLLNTLERSEQVFGYPVFVKPAGTGSSVGVARAENRKMLQEAILDALVYDEKVLIEEYIAGQEIEVSVLGNNNPQASVCGEIIANSSFYDYEAKYISDCAELVIPANISEKSVKEVQEAAIKIYRALGCRGLSRVDFFVKPGGEVVFNEINTMPGFTSISMYPKLFAASGIPYSELLDRLIRLSMEE